MRQIMPSRNYGDRQGDDVQHVIDQKPSTAAVSRPSGNTLKGERSLQPTATFECRIDMLPQGPRHLLDPNQNLGRAMSTTYQLLARKGKDRLSRDVVIRANDSVVVDGVTYKVIYVDKSSIHATNAVIEVTQA